VDAIQFQISFRELRLIASNFYELVYWTKMRPEINNR